jgi:3-phenylpropionate/trans-cinnamate dioxygenase ferredoxin subunit
MTDPSTSQVPTGDLRLVAASAEITHDTVVPHYLSDRRVRVSLARVDGRVYAFDDLCTCRAEACPLSSGLLTGRTIMCQCHGSRFDIETGAVVNGPATRPLTVYDVKEIDGDIRIRMTSR